jgi:glycosyltransferase involved in cell wall biosynthesis
LCVARQYPRKHVADLIRAFAQVQRSLPRARLVVIGDGPEHARLRRLVQKLGLQGGVQLLGALPDDAAVRAYYRRAAVFCLPSVQEGFGIVLLEAMAAGLPIVATTAAAVPEVVPHGQAGLLVPPSDPEALAEALIALLSAPGLRAEMGAFGAEYVARYDWARVAERFLAEAEHFTAAHDAERSNGR